MEAISGEYLELVQNCISFVRDFMTLPDSIEAYFENCPSIRFKTMDNAAEGSGNKLYFNKPWFTAQDRWENHRDDIEFFLFHELRHLHQQYEIALAENNETLQEVEIDANAYALCLSNMLHIMDDVELHFSVPEEAMNLAEPRSMQYYENCPELKRYMDKINRTAGQRVRKKPERNDPCPCGSGKKFKKCCIGKGIYD